MKRFFLTFLLLLGMCCNSAFAAHQLVVELTDGSTVKYVLADAPVITFPDTQLLITSSQAETRYERELVRRFYFEDATDDIKEVAVDRKEIRIDYSTADQVTIHGLNDASLVSVYDLTGKQILPIAVADDNTVTLNLSHLASGVYIIALPDHPSFKIKK